MATLTYRDALRQALVDAMRGGPRRLRHRRGGGPLRRRLWRDEGPDRGVRTGAPSRHADLGAGHRRRRGRRGDGRDAAGGRAHVRRLHRHDDGPALQPGRQDPLHVRRPDRRAHGAAHPRRHGPLGGRPAQPEPRGLRDAHAGPAARHARDGRTTPTTCSGRRCASPDPVVFIEHKALYAMAEDGRPRRARARLGPGGGAARGRATSSSSPTPGRSTSRWRRRRRSRRRASRRP